MTGEPERVQKAGVLKRGFLAVGWALLILICLGAGLWIVHRSQRPKPVLVLDEFIRPFTVLKRDETCSTFLQELLDRPENRVIHVQVQEPEAELIKRARTVLVPQGFVEEKVHISTLFTHADGTMIVTSTEKGVVSVGTAYVGGSISQFAEERLGQCVP